MRLSRLLYFFFLSVTFAVLPFFLWKDSVKSVPQNLEFKDYSSYASYEGDLKANKFAPSFRLAPISDAPAATAEVSSSTPIASLSASTAAVVTSTMSYFNPLKGRDPTLSPKDYAEIKKRVDEVERLKREREGQTRKRENNEMPKIHLQGIIGKSAIINGEMINEGQKYRGFQITKVGYDYIIGVFNGKRYRIKLE